MKLDHHEDHVFALRTRSLWSKEPTHQVPRRKRQTWQNRLTILLDLAGPAHSFKPEDRMISKEHDSINSNLALNYDRPAPDRTTDLIRRTTFAVNGQDGSRAWLVWRRRGGWMWLARLDAIKTLTVRLASRSRWEWGWCLCWWRGSVSTQLRAP